MDAIKKRKLDENGATAAATTDSDAVATPKLTPDDTRKLIESFTNDQLIQIVQNAAVLHSDVLDAVRSIADLEIAKRKLFVRGLGWETTTDNLRNLFAAYGDIDEAVVILDKATGKSKGYGFVTFKHIDGALLALKEPSKKIDGRMAVTQIAAPATSGAAATNLAQPHDASARKIYVANVPTEMAADRLLSHFSAYGEIEEGPLGFDKQTGKSRGFALFVYKSSESAAAALVDPVKVIDGHQMPCKIAIDWKKGKVGEVGAVAVAPPVGAGQVVSGVPGDKIGDGFGLTAPNSVAPQYGGGSVAMQYGGGSVAPQYGGGSGLLSSYGGFSGAAAGPSPLMQPTHYLNSTIPTAVGGGVGGVSGYVGSGSYGVSTGAYGGSSYGGPGSTGYSGLATGGLSGAAGGGLSGAAGGGLGAQGPSAYGGGLGAQGPSAYGGGLGSGGYGSAAGNLGAVGRGTSSYYGLPPSSAGVASAGYPETAGHYSLSTPSMYPSQPQQLGQQLGASTVPRVPPGGMYQSMPPYY